SELRARRERARMPTVSRALLLGSIRARRGLFAFALLPALLAEDRVHIVPRSARDARDGRGLRFGFARLLALLRRCGRRRLVGSRLSGLVVRGVGVDIVEQAFAAEPAAHERFDLTPARLRLGIELSE